MSRIKREEKSERKKARRIVQWELMRRKRARGIHTHYRLQYLNTWRHSSRIGAMPSCKMPTTREEK